MPKYIHRDCQKIIASKQFGEDHKNFNDSTNRRGYNVNMLSDGILVEAETVLTKYKEAKANERNLQAESVYNKSEQRNLRQVVSFSNLVRNHELDENNQIAKKGEGGGVILKSYMYEFEIEDAVEYIKSQGYRLPSGKSENDIINLIAMVMKARGNNFVESWLKDVIDASTLLVDLIKPMEESTPASVESSIPSHSTTRTTTSATTTMLESGNNGTSTSQSTSFMMVKHHQPTILSGHQQHPTNLTLPGQPIPMLQQQQLANSSLVNPVLGQLLSKYPWLLERLSMHPAVFQYLNTNPKEAEGLLKNPAMLQGFVFRCLPVPLFNPALMQQSMANGLQPMLYQPQQMVYPQQSSQAEKILMAGVNMMNSQATQRETTRKKEAEARIKEAEARKKEAEAKIETTKALNTALGLGGKQNEGLRDFISEKFNETKEIVQGEGIKTRSTVIASTRKAPRPCNTRTTTDNDGGTYQERDENKGPNQTPTGKGAVKAHENRDGLSPIHLRYESGSPLRSVDLNSQSTKAAVVLAADDDDDDGSTLITELIEQFNQNANDKGFTAKDKVVCDGMNATVVGTTKARVYLISDTKLNELKNSSNRRPPKRDTFYKSNKNVAKVEDAS